MEDRRDVLVKWLRILLYLNVASLALSLLGFLPIKRDWITWPSRALTAGVIYSMLCMGMFHSRYKTAAIFRAVQFSITLITSLVFIALLKWGVKTDNFEWQRPYNTISAITGSVALVLGWIGTYQLYHAHADVVAEKSPMLEKKWRSFFWVSLGIGLATSAASYLLALAYDSLIGNSGVVLSTIVNNLPTKIITLICVIYLHRTIGALEEE